MALTDIPIVSDSEMSQQMAALLEEASEEDAVHDALFKVRFFFIPFSLFLYFSNFSYFLSATFFPLQSLQNNHI